MGFFGKLFKRKPDPFAMPSSTAAVHAPTSKPRPGEQRVRAGSPRGVDQLCNRLGHSLQDLRGVPIRYQTFTIPKRSGKPRTIDAPHAELKKLQKDILRSLLKHLRAHPAAVGFERGHSIATNAKFHAGSAVVVRMDIKDFFNSTPAERVQEYFQTIGWDRDAAKLLTEICTHRGRLPQGAPTSPRLSNLVNRQLDVMLQRVADQFSARYTRYADDLTFSFAIDDPRTVHRLIEHVKSRVEFAGYQLHMKRKLHIRRQRSDQLLVTGLVVNERVNLPRKTRKRLRAIEHHAANGKPISMSESQLQGWRALMKMVEEQGR